MLGGDISEGCADRWRSTHYNPEEKAQNGTSGKELVSADIKARATVEGAKE